MNFESFRDREILENLGNIFGAGNPNIMPEAA